MLLEIKNTVLFSYYIFSMWCVYNQFQAVGLEILFTISHDPNRHPTSPSKRSYDASTSKNLLEGLQIQISLKRMLMVKSCKSQMIYNFFVTSLKDSSKCQRTAKRTTIYLKVHQTDISTKKLFSNLVVASSRIRKLNCQERDQILLQSD